MNLRKITIFAFLALWFYAWATACPAWAEAPLRLGYLQSDLHQLAAFIALKKGFFKKQGLNVEVGGIFKAGPEEMTAFASGALDFGYVGAAPAVVAVANKVAEVKVVAQVNLEGSAIVVGVGSPIKSLKDLKGKTVAVPGYGQVQDFLLRLALSKNHISLNAVKAIIIKPPEMISTLRAKEIDAFVAWEPYPAKAVTSKVGRVLIYSGAIWPRHPCCVVAVAKSFAQKHPGAVRRFVRAHLKATQYIKQNPKDALRLAQEFTGMDESTVSLGLRSLAYEYVINKQGILEYVRFLTKLGIIKAKDPVEFVNSFIDESVVAQALKNK